ncbi:MAG TPA: DNA repair protein RecO [Actinomycetota bacterium]|jgi:DNA repair protein RecO (recombination protein O)|nr:DNA repair protein RecO [Actinomycetota bacterium]
MSLYKDEAVVLRTMRLGEADRIVTLVGKNNGKIRAVVKGVRRTKSRYGGRLEPFSYVSLVIWKGKSDLHTITQAEVLDPFRAVKEDLDRLNLGSVMLEACDRVAQESEDSARVLNLLVESLRRLSADGSPMVLAAFLLQLCGIAGFAPSMDRCAECSRPASWFSPGQGGAVCPGCRSFDSEEVGTSVLELMSDLALPLSATPRLVGRPPSVEEMATAGRLARFYTEYHLERRLKSASAVEAMARF